MASTTDTDLEQEIRYWKLQLLNAPACEREERQRSIDRLIRLAELADEDIR